MEVAQHVFEYSPPAAHPCLGKALRRLAVQGIYQAPVGATSSGGMRDEALGAAD